MIITVETIAYVIAWTAFPLLMLIVTQRIGRPHRFFDFMVPYNWSQLPQSALFVLVGLETESGVLGAQPAQATPGSRGEHGVDRGRQHAGGVAHRTAAPRAAVVEREHPHDLID